MRPLSDDLQQIAREQLNEDPQRVAVDLEHLREWIAKQPHLKSRTDDQWLLSFLRGCKYSLEKTKEKLDFFYTIRGVCPELFKHRDPFSPEIQEILKMGIVFPLPYPLPTKEKVIIVRQAELNYEKIKMADVFKVILMESDILLNEDDNYVIAGAVVVHDLKNAQLSTITQTPFSVIRNFMTAGQKAYPVRQKGSYFINIPSFFHKVMPLFNMFLSEKIQKRTKIFTENELEKFNESFPTSVLPKEYGGEAGTIEELARKWKIKVESYKDWFIDDEKYGTDEKKRPGKPKTSDDLFGVDGSFRKLNID